VARLACARIEHNLSFADLTRQGGHFIADNVFNGIQPGENESRQEPPSDVFDSSVKQGN
jgi:hypothetical protein